MITVKIERNDETKKWHGRFTAKNGRSLMETKGYANHGDLRRMLVGVFSAASEDKIRLVDNCSQRLRRTKKREKSVIA
jgi:hypothetical protein